MKTNFIPGTAEYLEYEVEDYEFTVITDERVTAIAKAEGKE